MSASESGAYRIRNWESLYETHETKKLKRLAWVPMPIKHDGKGYGRVAALPDAGNIFAAFWLMVQVAAKTPTRGVLADDDGPLTAEDLFYKTRFAEEHFARAMQVLSDPQLKIQWLVAPDSAQNLPESPGVPGSAGISPRTNRIEQKGIEGKSVNPRARAREAPTPQADTSIETETPSSAELAELNMLVKQFAGKAQWTGNRRPIHEHLGDLLGHGYEAGDISADIEANVSPGAKPWDVTERVKGTKAKKPAAPAPTPAEHRYAFVLRRIQSGRVKALATPYGGYGECYVERGMIALRGKGIIGLNEFEGGKWNEASGPPAPRSPPAHEAQAKRDREAHAATVREQQKALAMGGT